MAIEPFLNQYVICWLGEASYTSWPLAVWYIALYWKQCNEHYRSFLLQYRLSYAEFLTFVCQGKAVLVFRNFSLTLLPWNPPPDVYIFERNVECWKCMLCLLDNWLFFLLFCVELKLDASSKPLRGALREGRGWVGGGKRLCLNLVAGLTSKWGPQPHHLKLAVMSGVSPLKASCAAASTRPHKKPND